MSNSKKLVFLMEMPTARGGMVQSVISLIKELCRYPQFDIYVVSPRGSEIAREDYGGGRVTHLTTEADSWTCGGMHPLRIARTARAVRAILKKIGPEAYYVTNNYGSSFVLTFCGLPWAREIFVSRGGNLHSAGLGGVIMRTKLRLHKVSHVIGISNRQARVVRRYGQPAERTTVIYNGLPMPTREYPAATLSKDNLRIASLGFISANKNQGAAVRAVALLQRQGINAHLNLYGAVASKGDEQYKAVLDKIIEQEGAGEFVHYKGFVKGEAPFADNDVVLSTSLSEGFGRTLVEGMLRRRVVIAWRGAGGPVDIADDGRCAYLTEQCTPEAFASLLARLVQSPAEVAAMVEAGYQRAQQMFTTASMTQAYARFFDSLP